jgi:hypothetical protein
MSTFGRRPGLVTDSDRGLPASQWHGDSDRRPTPGAEPSDVAPSADPPASQDPPATPRRRDHEPVRASCVTFKFKLSTGGASGSRERRATRRAAG